MNTVRKSAKSTLDGILLFFLIIASFDAAIFITSEIGVLSVFIITLIVYSLRKYDCRFLVAIGLFLLILSAIAFTWHGVANTDRIAIGAFYFLSIGVVGILTDFIRSQ